MHIYHLSYLSISYLSIAIEWCRDSKLQNKWKYVHKQEFVTHIRLEIFVRINFKRSKQNSEANLAKSGLRNTWINYVLD